ncbi:Dehydrodolichyl diphosphate synthase 6 [Sesamum alatum]|uniref:Alkyl transferase n=1 Tax=Sesamum alatum TaxID=300844 RepID=A0AAE1YHX8_9LAMI|nr:Dehydrodolichyl diphosphate synthase 6 [Sesamum alatum]
MDGKRDTILFKLFGSSVSYMRRCLFSVLSVGPVPNHLAFILDGNRRYAKKWNLGEGMGYRAGFLSLMSLIKYCYELGVKYVSIYAFSIDNFRRRPEEVQCVMDLMLEKIEGLLREQTLVNQYGVRVYFIGNLKLLHEPVRLAAEKAMKATSNNNNSILLICVAYTSTDEIAHAAQESCEDKWALIRSSVNEENDANDVIKLSDIESHMYMRVAPDPDILVRTSGETRLSNFLLWQTSNSLLFSPKALWPEIGLRHLVWAVLNFQRAHPYLERRRKQP